MDGKVGGVMEDYLSERQAAKYLGVCPRFLWGIRQRGEIGFERRGRRVVYTLCHLEAWRQRVTFVPECGVNNG